MIDVVDENKDWLVEKLGLGSNYDTPNEWKEYLDLLRAELMDGKFVEILN